MTEYKIEIKGNFATRTFPEKYEKMLDLISNYMKGVEEYKESKFLPVFKNGLIGIITSNSPDVSEGIAEMIKEADLFAVVRK